MTDAIILLKANANANTLMGVAIQQAIADGKPHEEIVGWVKSQAIDCPAGMAAVITEPVTNYLLSI